MTKSSAVALVAAVAAVGTTQAFVPSAPFNAGAAQSARGSSTQLHMAAKPHTVNPLIAAAMGLVLVGSDPSTLITMQPAPPAVQALQTGSIQTPADAVKQGQALLGNDPTGGANGGLFGNSQKGRESKAIEGTPGKELANNLGKAGDVIGKAGDAKGAVKGKVQSDINTAKSATNGGLNLNQAKNDAAGRVGGAKQKVSEDIENTKNAGDVKIAGRSAGDAVDAIKGAVGGKVDTDLNRASNAADKAGSAAKKPEAVGNAIKGAIATSLDIPMGTQFIGFNADQATSDAAGRVEGAKQKVQSDIDTTKNAGNVRIAGRTAGDAVDAVKGAVGGKVSGDISRAGDELQNGRLGDAKDNVKGKVSSDVNTAKRAVGVGFNAQGAADKVGDKVSSDVNTAKKAGGLFGGIFSGNQAANKAGEAADKVGNKVSSDVNTARKAGGALGANQAANKAGEAADKVGNKVSSDVDTAKNAGGGLGGIFSGNQAANKAGEAADKVGNKVSSDVDTAKNAGGALGGIFSGNQAANKAGEAADKVGNKVGSDVDTAKNAGGALGGIFSGNQVADKVGDKVSSDLDTAKRAGQNVAKNDANTEGGIFGLGQSKTGEFQPTGKGGQQYQTERPDNKQGIPGVTDQRSLQAQ